jgi:hypothetical protein
MNTFNGLNLCNKIELFINETFYLKMTSYRSLVPGKEYSVNSPDGIYKRMIFIDYDETYKFGLKCGALDSEWHRSMTYGTFIKYHDQKNGNYQFGLGRSLFYDPEEIKKNAQKARDKMEKRALDKILKRLVNEEFQW